MSSSNDDGSVPNPFLEEGETPVTSSSQSHSTSTPHDDDDGHNDELSTAVAEPTSAAYTSTEPYPQDATEEQLKAATASANANARPRMDLIQIVDALKTSEGANASYIVYCVRFEGKEARRRYSDFDSLRQALCLLYPCFIVPPLPPKNSLSSYALSGTKPSKAKEDAALVARRKRMLATFLNRTLAHRVLGVDRTFRKFLDPEWPWNDVLQSPPVTQVPKNPLRTSASDPTNAESLALFSTLPLPSTSASLHNPDQRFLDSEAFTNKFSNHLAGTMEKVNRRLMKRWNEAAGDWADMGGGMNGFALRMGEDGSGGLDDATERVGMAVDGYTSATNNMLQAWEKDFTEPLSEYTQFSAIIKQLLKYRHLKHVQYETTREVLENKRGALEELERSEVEAQRLEKALERIRLGGDAGLTTTGGATGSRLLSGEGGEGEAVNVVPPPVTTSPRKASTGLLGALSHTLSGIVDNDPEATRRNNITKTRESIAQLDAGIKALTTDLRYASSTIQADLDRFQRQKVNDLREMCVDLGKAHREWAQKNLEMWQSAKEAIEAIDID
ncbi:BZ3500_MvSof-1268-A1-R1_Chr2-3g05295 [Microbotryum saponariae]|uniref:BZ3500_MvSof-1268-A1-R1_Chr2-3g05295 protein n=1 Tax=Microbotryum saponariae TaxID=289078 RepID=A0A2X0N8E4_9BASI|nr:BZ3500_MvSof-1268-A1-R1_Chr2-3g05295 [Microbotryum saponariae]SDA01137.1 BZ3501_MvSof-1269-A2-R1_Chr2-2g04968 [Microbotryum saponariae]